MEAIIERCCGLDVHQAQVTACLLIGKANQKPRKEVRTFGAMTRDLIELREWLRSEGCTHVAMESTGVYWKPVYTILEDAFELIVGNAHHIKNVPGRKTDVKDAEWIADLLRHGLIAKSFVPPKPLRELRELVRYRRKLVESQSAERNRLIKVLEMANIKLSSVATDVFGKSGRLMIKAIIDGADAPIQMAQLAKGLLRKKIPELELALEGRVEEQHRFLLSLQLRRLEQVEADIALLEQRIDEKLEPYREQRTRLAEIPGVDKIVAAVLIAEIGVDMNVFHSERHLCAWAGVSPGNNESAGKHKSQRSRKGNVHLKTMLFEAATSASRKKGSYMRDKYHRLKARRGAAKAKMALAHKILIAAYHMLATGKQYHDLGDAYLDNLAKKRVTITLVRRLERLGYTVNLKEVNTVSAKQGPQVETA